MSNLTFHKQDLPFLLGGAGEVAIDIGKLNPLSTVDEKTSSLFDVSFNAGGGKLRFGKPDTVAVSVSSTANADLTLIFPSSTGDGAALLTSSGLTDFFRNGANADKVIVAFAVGATVRAGVSSEFTYAALQAGVELDAGADAGFAYLCAADRTTALLPMLGQFFKRMRLPEQPGPGDGLAPQPGESIALHYGGYLKLAAEVSAGYRLSGTKDFSVGGMALSEHYDLSVVGRVGLSAGVAGRFSIVVTAADGLPGWARVQVRRHRANDMKIAADVNVGFKNELDNLPETTDDFLGALLGVQAKSFLNVFQKARELSDFDQFKAATDGLAQRFVGEFVGKAFDALAAKPEFAAFLSRVDAVATSYAAVEDRSVALLDRYFDRRGQLADFLGRVGTLDNAGLDSLRKDLTPDLWNMLAQLTDGDPLSFLLRQVESGGVNVDTLVELKKRAAAALDLMQNDRHADLQRVISIAKTGFALDRLLVETAKVGSAAELKALATEKVGQFVTRLAGKALDTDPNVKQAFDQVRKVLDHIDDFKNGVFDAFRQAANSSYGLALHAEYSRASERDALVDLLIHLAHPRGPDLLAKAGKGDCEEILTIADTDLVRLREGVFTHKTHRDDGFNVNVLGWHLNYRYEGIDRLVTETRQRLVPTEHGMTVLTTADLSVERVRKRNDEAVHLNFLLRALGASANAVRATGRDTAFLIDVLKSLTARYTLAFTSGDTTPGELGDDLAFANDVGLSAKGATFDELAPLLPRAQDGNFGKIDTSYDVRFGANALAALIAIKEISAKGETSIRQAMRQMVLSNYLKSDELHDVAFAYLTPAVADVFHAEGAAFANQSSRTIAVDPGNSGVAAPKSVALNRVKLNVLASLYGIEDSMIASIRALYDVLNARTPMAPDAFEKRLAGFGAALKTFDEFDQTSSKHGVGMNTIFAMFDTLVRIGSAGDPANIAVLRLKSHANGREVEKLFLSDSAAAR